MDSDMVKVVTDLPGELRKCHKEETIDVNQEGAMINHYIQGQIFKKFPVFGQNKGRRMKMILEDDVGKINVFCLGEYASDLVKYSVGDTLYIVDAMVEKSPHYHQDGIHTHHLIIGGKGQPTVWVVPQTKRTYATDTDNETRTNPLPSKVHDQSSTSSKQRNQSSKTNSKALDPPLSPPRVTRHEQRKGRKVQQRTAESAAANTWIMSGFDEEQHNADEQQQQPKQKQKRTERNVAYPNTKSAMGSGITANTSSRSATASGNQQQQPQQQQIVGGSVPGTPNRQAAPGTPTRQAAPGTPNRQAAPGTPNRQAAPGTPNRQAAPGTPNRQAAPGTPNRQAATKNKSPQKRSYMYTKLLDVKETNSVNVYGVVKFFKPPRKTRGTDYYMGVTLIDPSLADPSDQDGSDISGLKCNLFQRDQRSLPPVLRVGDIVRLHRIKVQRYNNELQAMCGAGFAALVFDGRLNSPMKPRSSTAEYTVTQEDKDKVTELRRWAQTMSSVNADLSNPNRTLANVFIGQYFDLTCQVVAKALLTSESCVLIKVWDGTKCSWPVREIDTGDVGLEWDDTAAWRAEGLMVDVCLYDDHVPAGDKLKPGDYIRLYNLHALKYSPPGEAADNPVPMGELCLHRGTSYGRGVAVMSQYDPDVKDLIRSLDNVNRVGLPQSPAQHSPVNHGPSTSYQSNNHGGTSSSTANVGAASSPAATATSSRLTSSANGVAALSPAAAAASRRLNFASNQVANLRLHSPVASRRKGNQAVSSHCMQRSASIITDHVHIQTTSIGEVTAHKGPYLFRIRARVADFLPNDVEDFVSLYCPKCKFRCRVPRPQTSDSSSQEEETDDTAKRRLESETQARNLRSRRKRNAPGTTSPSQDEMSRRKSPRKHVSGTSHQPVEPDESIRKVAVVRPSNMKTTTKTKVAKRTVKGHKATAELDVNPSQPDEPGTVRVSIEDMTVQDALLLAHQGVKLQNYPAGVTTHNSQAESSSRLFYICPQCSSQSSSEKEETDDTTSLLQYRYCIKLFLEDGSGRIEVVLIDKHAETFFEDVPPVNLRENLESKFTLEGYMQKLCPYPLPPGQTTQPSMPRQSPSSSDNPHPWLDACIMSYETEVAGQQRMKYHMFHTTLALDVE